mmetsp:Transcript_384/g.1325  ORF Transcript_384/g.1325 Transcript_384/m.1325 type:complete len:446 (+) Transcript_384:964-2301(+)
MGHLAARRPHDGQPLPVPEGAHLPREGHAPPRRPCLERALCRLLHRDTCQRRGGHSGAPPPALLGRHHSPWRAGAPLAEVPLASLRDAVCRAGAAVVHHGHDSLLHPAAHPDAPLRQDELCGGVPPHRRAQVPGAGPPDHLERPDLRGGPRQERGAAHRQDGAPPPHRNPRVIRRRGAEELRERVRLLREGDGDRRHPQALHEATAPRQAQGGAEEDPHRGPSLPAHQPGHHGAGHQPGQGGAHAERGEGAHPRHVPRQQRAGPHGGDAAAPRLEGGRAQAGGARVGAQVLQDQEQDLQAQAPPGPSRAEALAQGQRRQGHLCQEGGGGGRRSRSRRRRRRRRGGPCRDEEGEAGEGEGGGGEDRQEHEQVRRDVLQGADVLWQRRQERQGLLPLPQRKGSQQGRHRPARGAPRPQDQPGCRQAPAEEQHGGAEPLAGVHLQGGR